MTAPTDHTGRARRVRGALLLVAVFAAGALAGAAADRLARPRATHGPTIRTQVMTDVPAVLDELGLTAEQRRQVTAILERGRPRSEAAMRELLPRIRAVADSIDQEVRAVLTPTQRSALDARRVRPSRIVLRRKVRGLDSSVREETLTVEKRR